MKKIGILSVLTLVLTMTLLLTACGNGKIGATSSFDKILNPDYDVSVKAFAKGEEVSELEGYTQIPDLDWRTDTLAFFSQANEETGAVSYKVYSMLNQKVVLTLDAEDANTTYVFNPQYSYYGLIFVTESVYSEPENPEDIVNPEDLFEVTYYVYDETGALIAETDEEITTPFYMGEMVVFDYVAYNVDEDTGAYEKAMDIPEYVLIDDEDSYLWWNDEYYYAIDDDDSVFVYDHSFNYVSSWVAPSYADVNGVYPLNNGDVFVQYSVELDEDAKDFDYYETEDGESVKYDLVTLLMKAKNGNTKEVDLKYMVEYVATNYDAYDAEDDNNEFNDSFDNVAYIYPIVNQRVDYSDAAADLVLMSDKGKIKKSLKLVDGQCAEIPQKIADDKYVVEMLHGGYALVNLDGEVLKMINSGAELYREGQYLVSERNVYDLNLEVIYDLKENDAFVLGEVDGVLFVQAGEDDEYTVYSFCDGEKKTVFSYTAENEESDLFMMTETGYVLIDILGEHTYYNAHGTELLTTDTWLEVVIATEDAVLYKTMDAIDDTLDAVYYVVSK